MSKDCLAVDRALRAHARAAAAGPDAGRDLVERVFLASVRQLPTRSDAEKTPRATPAVAGRIGSGSPARAPRRRSYLALAASLLLAFVLATEFQPSPPAGDGVLTEALPIWTLPGAAEGDDSPEFEEIVVLLDHRDRPDEELLADVQAFEEALGLAR